MKETRVCGLLGIEYPVLQGGMSLIGTAELAAAISNSGRLGVISPFAGMEEKGDPVVNVRFQLKKTRELTKKPFGVNVPLDARSSGLIIAALLEEGVEVVVTAAGNPGHYAELLHSTGIKHLHVVSSVKQAKRCESVGVNAIIAEGVEAAARTGLDEIPLFSLIPQVVDGVSVPVIAAGGIVDGRGVVAAFALGAEGVQLGTRFVATDECPANPRYKQAIVAAQDSDTIITRRNVVPTRRLKAPFSIVLSKMESASASAESIQKYTGRGRARKAQLNGDMTSGEAYAGSSAGLIKDSVPVATVMERLLDEYKKTMNKISLSPPRAFRPANGPDAISVGYFGDTELHM